MVLKHKLFRLCTLSFFLVIEYKAMAQGWVTDEVSKDNSGGIFSGILGFILLIGIIWFVGYVGDVIYENKQIHKNKKKQEYKSSQPKSIGQPIVPKVKKEDIIIQMLRYDGIDCIADKDYYVQQDLTPSVKDLEFIEKEKESYALTKILQSDKDNAVTDWWKDDPKEHRIREHGEADYSSDGKRLLFYWNKTEGYSINEGVEIICDASLSNLTSDDKDILLPSTVKTLGNCLYYYNWRDSFVIPNSIEIITGNPFTTCRGKIECLSPFFVYDKDILYDKDKKKIISVMWEYSESDDNKQIDPHVVMIGRYAFYGVILVRKMPLTIPSNVLYIGESAFEKTGFDISMSNGTIEIGDSAFAESHIHNFVLPLTVSKIGNNVFANCEFLERITISPNIKVLSCGAFLNCKKLNNVYIPNGVKIVRNNCFKGCSGLNEVWFPNSLEKIEKGAFSECPLTIAVLTKETIVEEGALANTCTIRYRS